MKCFSATGNVTGMSIFGVKKMPDKTKDCWSWAKREKPRWGLCKFTICNFIFFRNCMWSIDEFNQIFFHRYSMSKLHSKHWKLNSEQIFAKTLWIFYMDGLEFDPYWIDRLWNNICCHETNLCHANVEWRIYCWWAAERLFPFLAKLVAKRKDSVISVIDIVAY